MHEPGGDEGVLQCGRDALADSEHDAQEHSGVWRGHRIIERCRVALAQPRGKGRQAGSVGQNVEAGGLELEVNLALGKVGAAVKRRQVSRQHEFAGRLDLLAEARDRRSAPANHQVADAAHVRSADHDLVGLDEHFAAARGRTAVVGDATSDRRDAADKACGAHRCLGIGWGELGATDRKERERECHRQDGGTHGKCERETRNRERDGDDSEVRLEGREHDRGRQGDAP